MLRIRSLRSSRQSFFPTVWEAGSLFGPWSAIGSCLVAGGMIVHNEPIEERAQAIEKALSRIGQPIGEEEARRLVEREACECRQGMFALAATRRQMFGGAGLVAAVGMTAMLPHAAQSKAPPGAIEYDVPDDPTKEQGRMMGVDGGYGSRSQFEKEVRWFNPTKTASVTPMQNGYGIITPSGLHYERHHAGIPNIDPAKHRLIIHGLVDRPIKYSLADLKPSALESRRRSRTLPQWRSQYPRTERGCPPVAVITRKASRFTRPPARPVMAPTSRVSQAFLTCLPGRR